MKRWLQRIAFVLLGVIVLVVVALAGVFGVTDAAFGRDWSHVPASPLSVKQDSATVERGRHLGVAIAKCVGCHLPGLVGAAMIDDAAFGRFVASNLTAGRGGVLDAYSDAQLGRAIRHGIGADDRPLLFMPSHEFYELADDDVASIIAWMRTLPPADNELPPSQPGILARVLHVTGRLPDLLPAEIVRHDGPRPAPPTPGPTKEYGRYLTVVGGCIGCHGPGLSGGRIPGVPPDIKPATNLTPAGIGDWSEQDFVTAMRDGRRPDGTALDTFMPWQLAGQMTDTEMRAVWLFLQSVPARETGTR